MCLFAYLRAGSALADLYHLFSGRSMLNPSQTGTHFYTEEEGGGGEEGGEGGRQKKEEETPGKVIWLPSVAHSVFTGTWGIFSFK